MGTLMEEMRAAFERFDTDGSGDLDMEEITGVIKYLEPERCDAPSLAMFFLLGVHW